MSRTMHRRQLAGATGAALLLMGGARPAKAAGQDAELLAAFRRWQPWEEERLAVCRLPLGDRSWDARFDAYTHQWHAAMREVMCFPAYTREGVRAKATVLRATLLNHTMVERGDWVDAADASDSEKLAWSIAQDLLWRDVA